MLSGLLGFSVYISSSRDATKVKDNTPQVEEDATSRRQKLEEELAIANGMKIANRLEEECDYWGIDKYNQDGTISISKSMYSDWGGKPVLMLPRSSWDGLSKKEKKELIMYVSEKRGVTSILVGNIVPSEKYDRNTITVDETVWPDDPT